MIGEENVVVSEDKDPEDVVDGECDNDDCDGDDGDCKKPRYICVFKDDDNNEHHFTTLTAQEMRKALEKIPFDHVCCVWKGREKPIRCKSSISF